ncbi:hypothetical protein QTP70_027733 [Hemibagrus guttatus]|uniref:Reverse transcriptase domain-containing protein n=1 Tax=Hemibagrus guttatus TaxID=175788 RepID=A0AAE0QR10_9TELE|nr:hypothetical protein QTP70_027733 [Hemibagrus guttatus]
MKSFERLVLSYLKDITDPLLDPLQFAYRANRSVDDAVNMALHFILQHLDSPGSYARILFVDFSSAFNTIIPALLRDKLFQLNEPDSMCSWITDFLTDRRQFVRLGTHVSDLQHISTGSPQGCVLSPLLFSLYTNGCTSGHQSVKLLKFADDTTLIGLISDVDESAYRGTTITKELKWEQNIRSLTKKAQQRMYFLWQLKKFLLPVKMLVNFYTAIIESVLTSSITVWFAAATARDKAKLQRVIHSTEKVIGCSLPSLQELHLISVHSREKSSVREFFLATISTVAAEEVLQITRSCNPTTCPLDPIPSAMLQTISRDLLPFITTVINGSLTSGHVPTVFKKARVIPILKKSALHPSDISNYRPVSLLSFLSKNLERVVCNQLSDYLMQNNLHDPNQSGFKAAHSTETALLAVTEKLHAARSAKLSSVLILLDLSAAFDTVNHKTLLSTLRNLGICGTAWEWFASYLDGRSYQVTWKGLTSAPRRLSTGVPQGSVLGPLLFSLYTHSLGKVISSHGLSYHCYADDTQLIFSFPPSDTTASARISVCLADISSWMTAHQLKLNPSKTELLIIPDHDYFISDRNYLCQKHIFGFETDPHLALTLSSDAKPAKAKVEDPVAPATTEELSIRIGRGGTHIGKPPFIHPSSAIASLIRGKFIKHCLAQQQFSDGFLPGKGIRRKTLPNLTMRIVSTNFIPDRSRPGLTTTTIGAVDLQGTGGNWATVGRRSRGGRRVHRQREKRKDKMENGEVHHRRKATHSGQVAEEKEVGARPQEVICTSASSWRRIVLLILAITIHNIPADFKRAWLSGLDLELLEKPPLLHLRVPGKNLAIGIGIQNFPEGLAVSLPLKGSGMSTWRAFWYGQLSGMVEPVAGLLGAVAVVLAEPLLPYALAFAAGAMVYVVVDDIIPEAQVSGNGKLASWTSILGFIVMMSLDVGLG